MPDHTNTDTHAHGESPYTIVKLTPSDLELKDWKFLRELMEPNWHILFSHLLMFQFVYPSDYPEILPKWLFDELIERAKEQYDIPPSMEKVCRGPWIDQTQYQIDIKEWGYKSYTIKTV